MNSAGPQRVQDATLRERDALRLSCRSLMKDLEESRRFWQRPKRKVDFVRLCTILQRAEHLGRWEKCSMCSGNDGDCYACEGSGIFVPPSNPVFVAWLKADQP